MFLLLPSLILVFYAVLSGIVPLRVSRTAKVAASSLILLIALKFQIYLIGGSWFEPSVPRDVMLVMEALYGALIVFVALLFVKDLVLLFGRVFGKKQMTSALGFDRVSRIAALAIVSVLSGAWGTYEAVRLPSVKTVEITIPGIAEAWKGAKIVQLSDLHIGPVQGAKWLSAVVEQVNAEKPDVVLITGDFVDGTVEKRLPDLLPLKDLKSAYGTYGIPGNHEYYVEYLAWVEAIRSLGVSLFENESIVLEKSGKPLVVGGTTDFGAHRFGLESPNLAKTFADTPASPRILMTHQPKTTYRSTEPFDLQLSGHTHGGHIFFMYPLVGWFNDWLVSGYYRRGERQIYVNNGTGLWSGFCQRLFVPAEITVLIFR